MDYRGWYVGEYEREKQREIGGRGRYGGYVTLFLIINLAVPGDRK